MTLDDLAEFRSEWVEPMSTNYHGYDVFELPPPGQGFAALEMLNILEVCVPKLGFNSLTLGPSDPMTGICWSKRRSWPTPTCRRTTPIRSSRTCRSRELISKEYAAALCGRIDPNMPASRA